MNCPLMLYHSWNIFLIIAHDSPIDIHLTFIKFCRFHSHMNGSDWHMILAADSRIRYQTRYWMKYCTHGIFWTLSLGWDWNFGHSVSSEFINYFNQLYYIQPPSLCKTFLLLPSSYHLSALSFKQQGTPGCVDPAEITSYSECTSQWFSASRGVTLSQQDICPSPSIWGPTSERSTLAV